MENHFFLRNVLSGFFYLCCYYFEPREYISWILKVIYIFLFYFYGCCAFSNINFEIFKWFTDPPVDFIYFFLKLLSYSYILIMITFAIYNIFSLFNELFLFLLILIYLICLYYTGTKIIVLFLLLVRFIILISLVLLYFWSLKVFFFLFLLP